MCKFRILRNLLLVIVMQLTAEATESGEPCPKRWQEKDDKCFHISDEYANFYVAKGKCESMNSELAPVYSQEDLSRLAYVLIHPSQICNSYDNCAEYWIGVFDSTEQGKWTSTNGTLIPHADKYWAKGYPKEKERCVLLVLQPGKHDIRAEWKNENCARILKYICTRGAVISEHSEVTERPVEFDYVPEIGQSLYLNRELMTWDNARTACASFKTGAELVSIKDSAKQEAVKRYLEDKFKRPFRVQYNSLDSAYYGLTGPVSEKCFSYKWYENVVWIGGQRQDPNQCDTSFVWKYNRGSDIPFGFTNWHYGHPDCLKPDQHCVHVVSSSHYYWTDESCKEALCSVCEI